MIVEDQLNTRQICDVIGRYDASGGFHKSDYERISNIKSDQRADIADFILSFFQKSGPIRILTMPGKHWFFETRILERHKNTQIVGLEKSVSIFHTSGMAMPDAAYQVKSRRVGFLRHKICEYGTGHYQYYRSSTNTETRERSNRLLNMDFSTYSTTLFSNYRATIQQKEKFHEKFLRRNSAWLDFTSGFCSEVDTGIRHIAHCMCSSDKEKPIVITLMYGRDIGGGLEGRKNHLEQLCPSIRVLSDSIYIGSNGCPMVTFYCVCL